MSEYIIVKNANVCWDLFFNKDPRLGIGIEHSVYNTYECKKCKIKKSYTDINMAKKHLRDLNIKFTKCLYGVCVVDNDSTVKSIRVEVIDYPFIQNSIYSLE